MDDSAPTPRDTKRRSDRTSALGLRKKLAIALAAFAAAGAIFWWIVNSNMSSDERLTWRKDAMDDPKPTGPQEKHNPNTPSGEEHGHSEVRFEDTTLSVRGIVLVLLAIAATFVLVAFVSWRMLEPPGGAVQRGESLADYRSPTERLPPEPRLEPLVPEEDRLPSKIFVRQSALERILHSYGKTSEDGYVHIPIEKAMELAAEKLQSRETTQNLTRKSFGLLGGGEANSGRIYQEPPQWLQENN